MNSTIFNKYLCDKVYMTMTKVSRTRHTTKHKFSIHIIISNLALVFVCAYGICCFPLLRRFFLNRLNFWLFAFDDFFMLCSLEMIELPLIHPNSLSLGRFCSCVRESFQLLFAAIDGDSV